LFDLHSNFHFSVGSEHGLLVRELPIFACKIKKFNSDNKMDKRNILITDRAFYNFKPNDLFGSYPEAQRMIPLKQLFALVVSTSSEELMLYCLDQYDCTRMLKYFFCLRFEFNFSW
jgi:hypothetical protein